MRCIKRVTRRVKWNMASVAKDSRDQARRERDEVRTTTSGAESRLPPLISLTLCSRVVRRCGRRTESGVRQGNIKPDVFHERHYVAQSAIAGHGLKREQHAFDRSIIAVHFSERNHDLVSA